MVIVLDVGSMDGQQGLEKVAELTNNHNDPDYRLYAFEAHPKYAEEIRKKFAANINADRYLFPRIRLESSLQSTPICSIAFIKRSSIK